jgi:hypothetical protein
MHERVRSDGVRYRFVATATPSPNEYIELLAYCAFLGVMDVGQAKTRFFKRNSEKADQLTIHPHKEREFWLWMASWALFVQKPSDLGCSDEGYELPPIDVRWHEVPADHADAGTNMDGQAPHVQAPRRSAWSTPRARSATACRRAGQADGAARRRPGRAPVLWHDLEDERARDREGSPGGGHASTAPRTSKSARPR